MSDLKAPEHTVIVSGGFAMLGTAPAKGSTPQPLGAPPGPFQFPRRPRAEGLTFSTPGRYAVNTGAARRPRKELDMIENTVRWGQMRHCHGGDRLVAVYVNGFRVGELSWETDGRWRYYEPTKRQVVARYPKSAVDERIWPTLTKAKADLAIWFKYQPRMQGGTDVEA